MGFETGQTMLALGDVLARSQNPTLPPGHGFFSGLGEASTGRIHILPAANKPPGDRDSSLSCILSCPGPGSNCP